MTVHSAIFPRRISSLSATGPSFSSTFIELRSGQEQVIPRWTGARVRGDFRYGLAYATDVYDVLKFYRAHHPNGWLVYDPWDWSTTANGRTTEDGSQGQDASVDPEPTDQLLGVGDGTERSWQLVKRYEDQGEVHVRTITRPVAARFRCAFDGVEQLSGFTLNADSGTVTTTVPVGEEFTWGGDFYVVARFAEAIDEAGLLAVAQTHNVGTIPSIPWIEVVNPAIIDEGFPFGGHVEEAFATGFDISFSKRYHILSPASGGLTIRLPDESALPTGGVHAFLRNVGSDAVDFVYWDGSTPAFTIPADGEVYSLLLGISGGTREWVAF